MCFGWRVLLYHNFVVKILEIMNDFCEKCEFQNWQNHEFQIWYLVNFKFDKIVNFKIDKIVNFKIDKKNRQNREFQNWLN